MILNRIPWRRGIFPATVLLSTALLTPPAGAVGGNPSVDKNTIVFAVGRDIASLDAQVSNTGNSDRYAWQLYCYLYGFDKKGHLVPQAARDVEVSEDGLEYRFTLRNDVKFHNGTSLTPEDVKFAFERMIDPQVKSTRRPYFADVVDKAEVIDAETVAVTLQRRDAVFLNKVAAFVALIPKAYAQSLPSVEAFGREPISCGPYQFVEHKIGQSLELARFDDYFGNKPDIEHLIFRIIPDASSRVNALLTGEVDMADTIAPSDVKQLKEAQGIDMIPVPTGSPLHVRLYADEEGTPLHDRRVRLALNYAIDVESIIKNVMHGIGKPLTTFISSYYPIGASPELEPYGYDPEKARELLAEAGYPDGFETTLLSPTVYPKDVTQAVAAYWSAVGVRAKIKLLDYAAWNRLNNTHKSGPMTIMGYSNALYDPITPINGTASRDGTWSDYYNPEVEKLLEMTRSASDSSERDELFRKIGRILRDDAHAVLISEIFSVFAKDSDISWEPQFGYAFYDLRTVSWK